MSAAAAAVVPRTDPRDRRIADLEAENARLRAELARHQAEATRKKAKSGYAARRAALIAQGHWQPYVPAAPVRDHVRHVMTAAGMSLAQYAAAAGIDEGTLSKIVYNKQARVMTRVAVKIRRVTAATAVPDMGWVSAAGPSRRLQALTVTGWSVLLLARRLGMDEGCVRMIRDGDRQCVSATTSRRIRALYDDLWNTTPPERDRAEKIAAGKSRAYAARRGWVPAGAWDDDLIDDPSAVPAQGWKRAPQRRYRRLDELTAEARELFGFGLDHDAAAERLGVSRAALDKALERAGRRDEGMAQAGDAA